MTRTMPAANEIEAPTIATHIGVVGGHLVEEPEQRQHRGEGAEPGGETHPATQEQVLPAAEAIRAL